MDTQKVFLTVPGHEQVTNLNSDKYIASIELSNKCREFYKSRTEAAEIAKQKLAAPVTSSGERRKTSIDDAMETLRKEMTSLMDQDLSLMKTLLTLNEAIEDLKVQRYYNYSKSSMQSSRDLAGSDWSVSETDMYASEEDLPQKYPTPSSLSLQSKWSRGDELDNSSKGSSDILESAQRCNSCTNKKDLQEFYIKSTTSEISRRLLDNDILINGKTLRVFHEDQNSYDSGIHEPVRPKEIAV